MNIKKIIGGVLFYGPFCAFSIFILSHAPYEVLAVASVAAVLTSMFLGLWLMSDSQ